MHYTNTKTVIRNATSEVVLADYVGGEEPMKVIVKTVLPELTDEVVGRLFTAQSLLHKGIHEIVDFGVCSNKSPEKYYVASRYEPGVTLTQVLSRLDALQKKAPIPFVIHVLSEICETLGYVHGTVIDKKSKKCVLHGCVCPDNVIITMNGDVCFTDTGIGDLVRSRFTGAALVNNAPTVFRHPETGCGNPFSHHHEIYAAGLLLLCLLIGKNHFDGFCSRSEAESLKSVGDYFPSIPAELDAVIDKATRHRGLARLVRYNTVGQMARDLLAYSEKESVRYDREMTSLLIYALFNHLENEPELHHEEQRKKAREYIAGGNDNALKQLLGNLLGIKSSASVLIEEHSSFIMENGLGSDNDLLEHLAMDFEVISPKNLEDRETLYLEEIPEPVPEAGAAVESDALQMPSPDAAVAAPSAVGAVSQPDTTAAVSHDAVTEVKKNDGKKAAKQPEKERGTPAVVDSRHPFVKIVKKPVVVDAELITEETPPVVPERTRRGGVPRGQAELKERSTAFDSFVHLLREQSSSAGKKHHDSFANLLKKEKTDHGQ